MSSNKYIKLAEKYMDNVARHYDPVPQESAIIDFAIWLDKQAAEHSVQRTGFACDVGGCKKPGVVHLCEDHGLQ